MIALLLLSLLLRLLQPLPAPTVHRPLSTVHSLPQATVHRPLSTVHLLPQATVPPAFRQAIPGYHWSFPADDHPHPAFANEWWYFTGNLKTASGRPYGFELTFFRVSPAPGTPLAQQLFFTHFAISDIAGHRYSFWTRARRGNWQQAGAEKTNRGFALFNENWRATFDATGPRHLQAAWNNLTLDLDLVPGARTLNGINGWSQKGTAIGQASYYYSFPHIAAQGEINGQPASGLVWMDHEFATNQLAPNQQGWDWMGLHLPQGDLMLFNLRQTTGARDPHSAGTWTPKTGEPISLFAADFHMTPTRWWQAYPVAWQVQIPSLHLAFTVKANLDDQELRDPAIGVNYWEGAVTLSGPEAAGEGYLELTGYRARFGLLQ